MAVKPKQLCIGNWKMYVETVEDARALLSSIKRKAKRLGAEVWVAPPTPFIPIIGQNSNIHIGAQTVSPQTTGAHTGAVSARMLRESGATFVIVGHSEQREAGVTDEMVHQELTNVLAVGMQGVLCVGERERDEHGGHFEYIAQQLRSALASLPLSKVVIAYEPVWAIGKSTEEAAQPEVVRETVIFIRKTLAESAGRETALRVPVLYGGSVDGSNAAALMAEGEVQGFLVGRASTDAEQFLEIIAACTNPKNEIRNPKQIPNPKSRHTKQHKHARKKRK